MKAKLGLRLGAAGVLVFAGIASAAPPSLFVNRDNRNDFYISAGSYTADSWINKTISASHSYDRQGTYLYSTMYLHADGYAPEQGWIWVDVSCNVERDAIKVSGNARLASLSVYMSADDMSSRCTSNFVNVEPYTELAISAGLSAPESTYAETRSGVQTWSGGAQKYECRAVSGSYYQQIAAAVNDESWVPVEGEIWQWGYAQINTCNSNTR